MPKRPDQPDRTPVISYVFLGLLVVAVAAVVVVSLQMQSPTWSIPMIPGRGH